MISVNACIFVEGNVAKVKFFRVLLLYKIFRWQLRNSSFNKGRLRKTGRNGTVPGVLGIPLTAVRLV